MVTEHGVALEDSDRLGSSILDCDLSDMVSCINNLNRKRAGSYSRTSKSNDWEDLGNHF